MQRKGKRQNTIKKVASGGSLVHSIKTQKKFSTARNKKVMKNKTTAGILAILLGWLTTRAVSSTSFWVFAVVSAVSLVSSTVSSTSWTLKRSSRSVSALTRCSTSCNPIDLSSNKVKIVDHEKDPFCRSCFCCHLICFM